MILVANLVFYNENQPTTYSYKTQPLFYPEPKIFRKRDDVIIIDYSYNISVIGFSGPVEEKEKRKDHSDSIIDGIGKSSFCARFIKPHQVNLTQVQF